MAQKQRKKNQSTTPTLPFDRILVYALAVVVFAIPLFIWPGISEYGYGKSILMIIAVSILSVLWGLSAWQKGSWSIRVPWIVFPLLGFLVAGLLSLIAAVNGRVVIQSLLLVVVFVQFLLIILNAVREQRDVNLLLFSLLASAFFAALYGLLQYLGLMAGARTAGHGVTNVISAMGNRNYLGGFLAYTLFPSIVLVVRLKPRWLRIVAILLVAFCFGTALVLRQTSIPVVWMATAIAFVVGFAIFRPIEPIRRHRAWLIALLLALAITFLIEAPSGPLNSVVGLSKENPSWIVRMWERNSGDVRSWDWWIGLEMFKAHPLTGVGLGNYKLGFIPYKAAFLQSPQGADYQIYMPRAAQAHNEYVQILAEMGVLGLLALASLLVILPLSMWIRIRRAEDEASRFDLLLLGCGIVTFLVHALVSFPIHLPASVLVVVLLTGLIGSRVYGDAATRTARLRGWWLRGTVVGVAVAGLAVSIVAARDLAADFKMSDGIEQLQLGDYYGAETLLTESLALDFAPRQTYYHLAVAQIRLGKYEEALANLEKCRTRFVDEAALLTYANLAANLRRTDEALEVVELLLASQPNRDVETQARYIEATAIVQRGETMRASSLLQRLIDDEPTFTAAYVALGSLYEAQGLVFNAREILSEARGILTEQISEVQNELDSRSTFTASEYGQLRSEAENLAQQLQAVDAALSRLPADVSP